MLAKQHKFPLRQHPDFFNQASHVFTFLFTVWYLPQDVPQLAVSISKKTAQNATERNAIKRRVSAAWEKIFKEQSSVIPSYAIVLTSKKALVTATQQQIETTLRQAFKKLRT